MQGRPVGYTAKSGVAPWPHGPPPMPSAPPSPAPADPTPDTSRRDWHLALGAIVVPPLAPFVSVAMASTHWARRTSAWRSRIIALAIVDVICGALLVVAVARSGALAPNGATLLPRTARPSIGVELDPVHRGCAKVIGVRARSSAERAGMIVGDCVERASGETIGSSQDLVRVVGASGAREPLPVVVDRAGDKKHFDLVPIPRAELDAASPPGSAPAPKVDRFDVNRTAFEVLRRTFAGWSSIAIFSIIVAGVGSRRGARATWPVGLFALSLLGAGLSPIVSIPALRAGGLPEPLESSSAVLSASLMLLCVGAIQASLVARRAPAVGEVSATVSRMASTWRGLFYAYGGAGRAAIVIAALDPHALVQTDPSELLTPFAAHGTLGLGIFVVTAVVIGPIGEELLFRGALAGWLSSWAHPRVVVVVSAIGFALAHPHYGSGMLLVLAYGVALAWARIASRSLWPPIAIHMMLNAIALAFAALRLG